jgi:hypothetical protein
MEFVCRDPGATVRAANVRATLDAFRLMPAMGRRLVERHQLTLDDLTPDKFVPLQRWLDALKDLQAGVGDAMLCRVGMAIIENAFFPPELPNLDAVLGALDKIYYMNHTGDVGHYHTRRLSKGAWEVRCETPYPRQFERGLIQGFCRHPRLTGGDVYHAAYSEGPAGADHTCTVIVTNLGPARRRGSHQ